MIEKEQNILVVGSEGRIGKNVVSSLLKQGHKLILADKKKFIKHKNKKIYFYKNDITKEKNIIKLINFCKKKINKIDTVIYCAYPKNKKFGRKFEKLKEKDVNENILYQISSLILFCKNITQFFLKQKRGNLILFSSILGLRAPKFHHYKGTSITCPIEYSASKASTIAIVKYLANYYKKKNLRFNCISPGGILDNQSKIFLKRYNKDCNSKGMLDSEDILGTIKFLISEDSKYINGQNIIVDDGWSL